MASHSGPESRQARGPSGPLSGSRAAGMLGKGVGPFISEEAVVAEAVVGLAEAIESVRADLLAARASGEDADVRFPVQSVTIVLQVVATTDVDGKAGFKVPVVNVELGASASRKWENTSTVTVAFGPPVDRSGAPVKVASTSSRAKG